MSVFLKVMIVIDAVLLIALLIVPFVRFKKSVDEASDNSVAPVPTEEPVAAPVIEEKPIEETVEEAPAPAEEVVPETAEEPVTEVAPAEEPVKPVEVVIGNANAVVAKRVPFNEKMLFAEKKVQNYYNAVYNAFISYRKINPRVSSKGISYRLGRQLVAKLTIRGKTLRFHLALPMDAVNEKVYFQRDFSGTKAYAEVPFTVKIKSDRGLKNALKLIEVLAEQHGIEKKTRFTEVDSIELLKSVK